MTASNASESSSPVSWQDIICADQSAVITWTHIFQRLQSLALAATSPAALHRETVTPDRLLSETAWDLWQQFPTTAPSVIAGIRDFWQGRRLLITSDHGYATTAEFSSEVKSPEIVRLLAGEFGAQRAIREDPASPWPQRQFPPPVLRFPDAGGAWLVVTGQRKWKVSGGFPTLCHRGLSLLEAAVPMIELPPL